MSASLSNAPRQAAPVPLLARLVEPPAADWVVPRWRGRFEPLCALYGPAALAALARQVEGGRFGLHEIASADVAVRTVDDAELARFGDPETLFLNVNTKDDWERCRRLAG